MFLASTAIITGRILKGILDSLVLTLYFIHCYISSPTKPFSFLITSPFLLFTCCRFVLYYYYSKVLHKVCRRLYCTTGTCWSGITLFSYTCCHLEIYNYLQAYKKTSLFGLSAPRAKHGIIPKYVFNQIFLYRTIISICHIYNNLATICRKSQ